MNPKKYILYIISIYYILHWALYAYIVLFGRSYEALLIGYSTIMVFIPSIVIIIIIIFKYYIETRGDKYIINIYEKVALIFCSLSIVSKILLFALSGVIE